MKVTTLNMVTDGILLPPKEGVCQKCAVDHEPWQAHNQQSLFWQYWFYKDSGGKWPTWRDAVAHCAPDVQKFWIDRLTEMGVDVGKKTRAKRKAPKP